MKFLCDQMLAKLSRWLRAAGYDTELETSQTVDAKILARALQEHRLLLTRDRHFLEIPEEKDQVLYLHANSFPECVQVLSKFVHIDWLYKPFSRCLLRNGLLREITDPLPLSNLPTQFAMREKKFWICDHCKKIYWEGSHTHHMYDQLHKWNKGQFF